ncbi:hypothetical protein [Celerinatantimonas sp. YJH-8]|uniref:hypothetical protein n=1 Tax=Celerinatantimonas sp. YJH-8 TaxID=3228714 RepID=UPI0038C235A6
MADQSGLSAMAETLKTAVGDLASLEVMTYTGSISAVVKDGKFQWDKLLPDGDTTADIHLLLATKIDIDGDATHFVASGEIPQFMLDTHAEAVRNGSEYRTQIINFLVGKVSGIIG